MSSRVAIVAALALAMFACSEDAATRVEVKGQVLVNVELVPPSDPTLGIRDTGSYRWFIVEAPAGSLVPNPNGGATAAFQPDLRGAYVVERWFVSGVGEDLTHRFVVSVNGARPIAALAADPDPQVGARVSIDGRESWSPERRPLTHHWRLVLRPLGSQTVIEEDAALARIVPDVAGGYVIELAVFDGELWNDNLSTVLVTAK